MELEKLKIVGKEEWCVFSQLKIPAIRARIDSGAKTSSIQATEIQLTDKNNEEWVSFIVHPLQRNSAVKITCSAKVEDRRSIKGSFGVAEERIIIKTPVTIGEDTFDIELSLANRNTMEFKMLLGREALTNRYLINPAIKQVQKSYSKWEVDMMYKAQIKNTSDSK